MSVPSNFRTRTQQWFNNLALCLLRALITNDTQADRDPPIEEATTIEPVSARERTLAILLSSATPDTLHPEIDTGPAVGNEIIDQ